MPRARQPLVYVATLVAALCATACATRTTTSAPGRLGDVIAMSELDFGRYASIRVLSDGRVLIVGEGRRLWELDRNLRNARFIADSASAPTLMDVPGSSINPYLGDSSLLVKSGLGRIVILDERARPIRNVTARQPLRSGLGPTVGEWTSDMVRAPFTRQGEIMTIANGIIRTLPDSSGIQTDQVVRTSFADPNRRDTVGQITRQWMRRVGPPNATRISWIQTGDAAGIFPDGTIAIIRTKTYSVELIERSGRRREVVIPHEWIVLSHADKEAAMDSLRQAALGPGLGLEVRSSTGALVSSSTGQVVVTSRLSDIRDTVPPIGSFNEVLEDASGHLWIEKIVVRTNPFRHVRDKHYDVIDRDGRLVRRVVLPPNATIKAFAPGRVYYLDEVRGRARLVMAHSR